MCYVHRYLQEPQAVVIMLYRITFHLSGEVVALHLDNRIAKAYIYNQGDTASFFPD